MSAQRFFVEPELFAGQTLEDLFLDGDRVATLSSSSTTAGALDFGWNLSQAAQLRVGYWASDRQCQASRPGRPTCRRPMTVDAGLRLSARYDSRDSG